MLTFLSLRHSRVGNNNRDYSRGFGDCFQVNQADASASNDSNFHSLGFLLFDSHGQRRLGAIGVPLLEGECKTILAEDTECKDSNDILHGGLFSFQRSCNDRSPLDELYLPFLTR